MALVCLVLYWLDTTNIMGAVFGRTGVKEPTYSVLFKSSANYEVRQYQKYFIAEVPHRNDGNDFRTLARYIGVFGQPENEPRKPLAMTAPVLMDPTSTTSNSNGQQMAMTAPVINTDKTMSFVLPFELKELSDVPKPRDPRIKIKQSNGRTVAVDSFSGWYSDAVGQERFTALCEKLKKDGIIGENEVPNWSVAQYHPPFTIPFFRRNEIWVDVNKDKIQVGK